MAIQFPSFGMFLAWLQLFLQLIALLVVRVLLKEVEWGFGLKLLYWFINFEVAVLNISILATISLIYGIAKKRERFMKPWILCNLVIICKLGLIIIGVIITYLFNDSIEILLFIPFNVFIIVCAALFLWPTCKLYNEIKQENKPKPTIMESRIINV